MSGLSTGMGFHPNRETAVNPEAKTTVERWDDGPIPNPRKGVEGMRHADEILKKQGAIGLLVGGLVSEIWAKPEVTVEDLDQHKDVDVLILSPKQFTPKKRWQGGIDWWAYDYSVDGITSPGEFALGDSAPHQKVVFHYGVEVAELNKLQPGLYIPDAEFLESVARIELAAGMLSKDMIRELLLDNLIQTHLDVDEGEILPLTKEEVVDHLIDAVHIENESTKYPSTPALGSIGTLRPESIKSVLKERLKTTEQDNTTSSPAGKMGSLAIATANEAEQIHWLASLPKVSVKVLPRSSLVEMMEDAMVEEAHENPHFDYDMYESKHMYDYYDHWSDFDDSDSYDADFMIAYFKDIMSHNLADINEIVDYVANKMGGLRGDDDPDDPTDEWRKLSAWLIANGGDAQYVYDMFKDNPRLQAHLYDIFTSAGVDIDKSKLFEDIVSDGLISKYMIDMFREYGLDDETMLQIIDRYPEHPDAKDDEWIDEIRQYLQSD